MGSRDTEDTLSPAPCLPEALPQEEQDTSLAVDAESSSHIDESPAAAAEESSTLSVNSKMEEDHVAISTVDIISDVNAVPQISTEVVATEPLLTTSADMTSLEGSPQSSALVLHAGSNNVNTAEVSSTLPYEPATTAPLSEVGHDYTSSQQSVMSSASNMSFTPLDVTSYTECGVIYEGDNPVRVYSPYSRGYYPEDDSYSRNSRVDSTSTPPFMWHSPSVWRVVAPSSTPPAPPPPPPHPNHHSLTSLTISDNSQQNGGPASLPASPVELQVTNLDQNIDAREMKKLLFSFFREHVMVLHVSMLVQSDGNLAASLRFPSAHDAQYAISQLHRKKIGAKRIIISYVNHNQPSPELKRSKVISLLQEVPGKKLPLFKFRELYERRFHETIGVSEMYNMRDIVTVSDNSIGRMVALHPEYRNMSQAALTYSPPEPSGVTRFCRKHSSGPDASIGWAERDYTICLPNVQVTLKTLANTIPLLMESHDGLIPLVSLVDCYAAEIGPVEEVIDAGVPFEHLVSCLPDISIDTSAGGFKFIQWAKNKPSMDDLEDLARFVSPPLVGQLALFSRELVDLMKTFPHTRLPFPRFIPAYHHHFGRQCRVADYGFTKLADLFDALPHVVQVLGEGNRRIITLAHRAQIKRFSSDLLRVLKSQPAKVIQLSQFSLAYSKTIGKFWDVTDYGVNDIDDLLSEVNETTVLVTRFDDDLTIAIPKREQTPDEIERTRQFAAEVVELLRHSPQCKMHFNRFIPAYHHHFGRQCRVADYGFTKLIELFEAIPDLLEIFDDEEDGEKQLQLVEKERLRVLGEQLVVVVKGSPRQCLSVEALRQVFTHYYGYALRPYQYGHGSLNSLLQALNNYVKVSGVGGDALVRAVDRCQAHIELTRARALLWQQPDCSMPLDDFVALYRDTYGVQPNISLLTADIDKSVTVTVTGGGVSTVQLSGLQVFARDLLSVLQDAGGRMLLTNFETAYLDKLGVPCRPARYGFASVVALVHALSDLVTVKGRGIKKLLLLLPIRDGGDNTLCTGGSEAGGYSRWKGGSNSMKDINNNSTSVNDFTSDVVSLTTSTTNGSDRVNASSDVDEHLNSTAGSAAGKEFVRYDKCFVGGGYIPDTGAATTEVTGSHVVSEVHQVNGVAVTTQSISLSRSVFNLDSFGKYATTSTTHVDRSLDFPFEFPFKLSGQSKLSNLNRRSSLENGPGLYAASKDNFQSTLMKASSLQTLGGGSTKEETSHPNTATSEASALSNGTSSILARMGSLFSSSSVFPSADFPRSQTMQKSLLQNSFSTANLDGNANLRTPTVTNAAPNTRSLGPLANGNFHYGQRNSRMSNGRELYNRNSAVNGSSFSSNYMRDPFPISNYNGAGKTNGYGRPCTSTPHASTDSTDDNGTDVQLPTNVTHSGYDKFRQPSQGDKFPYNNRDQKNTHSSFSNSYSSYSNGYRSSSQDSRLARNRVSSNSYNAVNGTSRTARGSSLANARSSNGSEQGFRNTSTSVSYSPYRDAGPRPSYGESPRRSYGPGYDGPPQYFSRRSSFSRPLRSQSSYSNYHLTTKHNGQYRDGPQSQRTEPLPVPGGGGGRDNREGPPDLCDQSAPQGGGGLPIPGRGLSDISQSPPYDFQSCLPDGSGVFMSVPPPPAQAYQSSLMFSGSPVAGGGGASVMWGQIWSPATQYPTVIASPMSPAHYVIPSGLSVSWSSIAASPPSLPMTLPPHTPPAARHTISMHTLDHPAQCGYNVPPPPELGPALPFSQSTEPDCSTSDQVLPHTYLVQQPPPLTPVSQALNTTQPVYFGPTAPLHASLPDVTNGPFSPPQASFPPVNIGSPFDAPPHITTSRPSSDLSSTVDPQSVNFGMCPAPTYSFANTMSFENPYTMSEVLPACSLDSNIFSPMFVPSFTSCASTDQVSFAPVLQSPLTYPPSYPTSSAVSPASEHASACVDSLISPLINHDLGVEISPQVSSSSTMPSSLAVMSTSASVSCGSAGNSYQGDGSILNATPGSTSRRLAAQFTNRVVGSSVTDTGPAKDGQAATSNSTY